MRRGKTPNTPILIGVLVTALAWPTSTLGQEDAAATRDSAAGASVEEIVVHARRRAELLEDTPVSITVLDASSFSDRSITRIEQIQDLVPNLTIFRTLSGESASIVMRGVGNFPFIYFDQGVGLYVDGVFLARNNGSVLDVVDIAQMEVLRGPQGTLFGKNSLGGAISITTVAPHNEFEANISLKTGSFDTFNYRATVNVPFIEDRVFGRFTFAEFSNRGYTFNTLRNEHYSDRDSRNFLGSLLFQITDDIEFRVTGSYAKSHARGLGGQCVPSPLRAPAFEVPGAFTDGYDVAYREACEESEPYRFESDEHSVSAIESYGAWGTLKWELGDFGPIQDLGLKMTGAWREQESKTRLDYDMTRFPVAVISNTGGGGAFDGEPTFQRQMQGELELGGSALDGRFDFVAGLFTYWEEADQEQGFSFFVDALDNPFGHLVSEQGLSENFARTNNWDWAIFTQGTLRVTDWMSLTAGIRYTEEKKQLIRELIEPTRRAPRSTVAVPLTDQSLITTKFTPMASISLTMPEEYLDGTPLDHLMTYFTYAQGFRGAGFNGGARSANPETLEPFDAEVVDSFEVGLKIIAFEQRLSASLSLFQADRDNQQVPQIVTDDSVIPPTTDVLTRNAASNRSRGVELEFQARPLDMLVMNGSVGFLESIYNGFPGAENAITGEIIDRAGERLPFVPQWQTNFGIQYSIPVPMPGPEWAQGLLTPRLDWNFVSRTANWANEIDALVQDAYHVLNFRLSYTFNQGDSQAAFLITNLTDEEYFRESLAIPRVTGGFIRYFEPPRFFGFEMSHRFGGAS